MFGGRNSFDASLLGEGRLSQRDRPDLTSGQPLPIGGGFDVREAFAPEESYLSKVKAAVSSFLSAIPDNIRVGLIYALIAILAYAAVASEGVFGYFMWIETQDALEYLAGLLVLPVVDKVVEVLSGMLAGGDFAANVTGVRPGNDIRKLLNAFVDYPSVKKSFPRLRETAFFKSMLETPQQRAAKGGATEAQCELMTKEGRLRFLLEKMLANSPVENSLSEEQLRKQEALKTLTKRVEETLSAAKNNAEKQPSAIPVDQRVWSISENQANFRDILSQPTLSVEDSPTSPRLSLSTDFDEEEEDAYGPDPGPMRQATKSFEWNVYYHTSFAPTVASFPIGPLANVVALSPFVEKVSTPLSETFPGMFPTVPYVLEEDPLGFWLTTLVVVLTGGAYYMMLSYFDAKESSRDLADFMSSGQTKEFYKRLYELRHGREIYNDFLFKLISNTVVRAIAFWFLADAWVGMTTKNYGWRVTFATIGLVVGAVSTLVTRGGIAYNLLYPFRGFLEPSKWVAELNKFSDHNLGNSAYEGSWTNALATDAAAAVSAGLIFGALELFFSRALLMVSSSIIYAVTQEKLGYDLRGGMLGAALFISLGFILYKGWVKDAFWTQKYASRRELETGGYNLLVGSVPAQVYCLEKAGSGDDARSLNTEPLYALQGNELIKALMNQLRANSIVTDAYLAQVDLKALIDPYKTWKDASQGRDFQWPGVQRLLGAERNAEEDLYPVAPQEFKVFDEEMKSTLEVLIALQADKGMYQDLQVYGEGLLLALFKDTGAGKLSIGAQSGFTIFILVCAFLGQIDRMLTTYEFADEQIGEHCAPMSEEGNAEMDMMFCQGTTKYDIFAFVSVFAPFVVISAFQYMAEKNVLGFLGLANAMFTKDQSSPAVSAAFFSDPNVKSMLFARPGERNEFNAPFDDSVVYEKSMFFARPPANRVGHQSVLVVDSGVHSTEANMV